MKMGESRMARTHQQGEGTATGANKGQVITNTPIAHAHIDKDNNTLECK